MINNKEKFLRKIKNKIRKEKGLKFFLQNRAKFEGWLKTILCGILASYGYKNIIPEKDRIDIVVEDEWAIELKVIITNYNLGNNQKRKPLTKNINSILKDIQSLKQINYKYKTILFVVYPLINKKYIENFEENYIEKLKNLGVEIISLTFDTNNTKIKLYFGIIF